MWSVQSWPDILVPASLSITHRKLSPNQPMTNCPSPCHDPPFFETLINRGLPGGTIFSMYPRFTNQRVCNDVLHVLHILVRFHLDCWEDPTGWFLFLNIIIKMLDLFQFQVVSDSKYSDWWFKLICFCNYDSVLDLKHCLPLINTYSYSL